MAISAEMRDYDNFISQSEKALAELIYMHLNAPEAWIEEIGYHGDDRFLCRDVFTLWRNKSPLANQNHLEIFLRICSYVVSINLLQI